MRAPFFVDVAQLVEHHVANVDVASSSLVICSMLLSFDSGSNSFGLSMWLS